VVSWLVSDYIDPKMRGKFTWIQEFAGNFGSMFGSLLFGVLTLMLGMSVSFVVVGMIIFVISSVGLIQRFHLLRRFK
jgi:MFS family permease